MRFDLFLLTVLSNRLQLQPRTMNNKAINIRITAELRDKLKAAAKAAGMPVSVFLRIVLTRIVKQP